MLVLDWLLWDSSLKKMVASYFEIILIIAQLIMGPLPFPIPFLWQQDRNVAIRAGNSLSLVVFSNYKFSFDDHDFKYSHMFDA